MDAGNGPFRVDLHIHTGRYSECAECVDPKQIQEHALRAGLAGVVLTEHNVLWQDEELELLRAGSPAIRIYRGVEVTADGCHLVVIGIDDGAPLAHASSLEEVAEAVGCLGAAVILAHPYREGEVNGLPVVLVDAIEIASTSASAEEGRRAAQLARRFGKPTVAASDAHALARIGWAWTEFDTLPEDERGLARAIRLGLGRAVAPGPLQGSTKRRR